MRLKICLSVLITLCACKTYGFAIKETNKITSKEWHCTNICKTCYGEPYFDKINEKCYCSLRKGNSIEDRTCRDAMKLNSKVHDLHLIIKEIPEPSNRVRRDEPKLEETTPKTEIIQSTNTAAETVTDAPEPILAENNPESASNVTTTTTSTPVENANIVAVTNTKAKAIANKNAIERKSRPSPKIVGARRSSTTQDKQIDDLVAEAQQKVEEFVVISRQNPKEAQYKIKDIQGTLNKVANRLKHSNEPPSLQERINQIEERLASRKATTQSTLIVEPANLVGEANPEENTNNEQIVGSRRHPVHRQRYPLPRRITHNEENSHSRPRLHHNENEESSRSRIRLVPRSRLRDRLGAKNPMETTAQNNEENVLNAETAPKTTEPIVAETKTDEPIVGNAKTDETLKNTEPIVSSTKTDESQNTEPIVANTKTDDLLTNKNVENIETIPVNNEI